MKDVKNIKALEKKYYEGLTTLEEEAKLKAFWKSKENTPEKLWLDDIADFKSESNHPNQKKKTVHLRWLLPSASVAAAIALLILFFKPNSKPSYSEDSMVNEIVLNDEISGEIEDPELAYAQTKKALSFIGKHFNQANENIKKMNQFGTTIKEIKTK